MSTITDRIYLRQANILAKLETNPGEDALPSGADVIRVRNFNLTPIDGDEAVYEQIKPFFGNDNAELVTQWVKMDFEVYLAGSGTKGTPPVISKYLQAAGLAENVTAATKVLYSPVSENIPALSQYCNINGLLHKMVSARPDIVFTTDAKGYPVAKITVTGLFKPVTFAAPPALVYPVTAKAVPVNAANTTFSLHGVALATSAFSLNMGNQVVYDNVIGEESVDITDRKATYSATFRATKPDSKNWHSLAISGAKGAMELLHGKTEGNIVKIGSPSATVGKPSHSDRNGLLYYTVNGRLVPSDAGGDDFYLEFA